MFGGHRTRVVVSPLTPQRPDFYPLSTQRRRDLSWSCAIQISTIGLPDKAIYAMTALHAGLHKLTKELEKTSAGLGRGVSTHATVTAVEAVRANAL